jgi:HAD superfamily hydrolase (TIGR01549 family)
MPFACANMCHMSPARAVLLDLDDTLIVEESHAMAQIRATAALAGADPDGWDEIVLAAARAEWYASEYHPACKAIGISSWEGLWATFEGAHPLIAPVANWTGTYRLKAWTRALESDDRDPALAPLLSERYIALQRAGHPLDPGAAELVRRAAAVGPVAIVTNGPPDIQRLKIEQTGLANAFSVIVISGELGIGKPDPRIFGHALEALGALSAPGTRAIDPGDAVMVGDSWERDIEGALGAGLRAVWISHGSEPSGEDPRIMVVAEAGDVRFE